VENNPWRWNWRRRASVRDFEREREGDDERRSEKLVIAGQALLRMTPSMTLATSSHLSTAVSMTSKISFHLMIWTGSVSSSKSWAISVRQRRSLSFSVAVDLDAVLEGALRRFDGANGGLDLGSCGDENLHEVEGSGTDGVHTIEHEAAGGGVNEVDDVVELAAELVDVFAVERSEKVWFSLVKMACVISSPSCSMALTICTCSGTPV